MPSFQIKHSPGIWRRRVWGKGSQQGNPQYQASVVGRVGKWAQPIKTAMLPKQAASLGIQCNGAKSPCCKPLPMCKCSREGKEVGAAILKSTAP